MKVLVIDDHPVFREGLAAILRQIEPDAAVTQVGDAAQALAMISERADFDIVILDLLLPGIGGLAAIAEFSRIRPDLPIIVLSSSEDPRHARATLAQGALGYVPKSAAPHTLLSAIRLVLNGDVYVPPLILEEVRAAHPPPPQSAGAIEGATLTARQLNVLRGLVDGLSNRAIAENLDLSEKTVKAHVTAIFKALNVVSRTQAAVVARARSLI